MAWVSDADLLSKIRNAIEAKISGGGVESYVLPDGTNIRTTPLEQLRAYEKGLVQQIQAESTTRAFRLADLRGQ